MGFGDKLKGLRDQAQQAVAENKDRIQDAVQVAGDIANTKTHGKYANKIGKVGMKVEAGIEKLAEDPQAGEETAATPPPADPQPNPDFDISDGAPTEDSSSAPVAHEPHNPVTPSAADTARAGFPDFE
jgi:hypothetical protein